jgi:hypothetical protein
MKKERSLTAWRRMTVSSVLQIPGVMLLIIIGLALLITILFTGRISEVNSPGNGYPKYTETNTGGR